MKFTRIIIINDRNGLRVQLIVTFVIKDNILVVVAFLIVLIVLIVIFS